jgi:hypothetical protein
LSEKSVLERAREIRDWITLGDVEISHYYTGQSSIEDSLESNLNDFTEAESENDEKSMKQYALYVVKNFTTLSVNGHATPSEGLLHKYNSLVKRWNAKLVEVEAVEKDLNKTLTNYEKLKARHSQLREIYEAETGRTLPPLPKDE